MSVTQLQFVDRDDFLCQVEKLVHSQTFRKAESLCKLLRYLGDHALNHPHVPMKEYQIASEVFGRADFDPQSDSAIRVQVGRLRLKLHDYYGHEGAADRVVVDMPNGLYTLSFSYRDPIVAPTVVRPTVVATPDAPRLELVRSIPSMNRRRWMTAVAALSVLLVAAFASITFLSIALYSARSASGNKDKEKEQISEPLRSFWSLFARAPESPWVIFSNANFVGRPETGMRYLDPARDSHEVVLDHYTGVGEVLGVHELDRVFNLLNRSIDLKRGSLFSLDDAKKKDLIFIGSPAENLTLLDLPGTEEFVFKRMPTGSHKGKLAIMETHAPYNQQGVFYPTNSSQPLVEDYAIVALIPGLKPDRHVLILAGTTTIGTQAAVEYVCATDSVAELLRKLSVGRGETIKPFEALLRVRVARGVPVGTELVAVHERSEGHSGY